MSHVRSEFNFKELFEKLEEIESTGISGSGISMSPVLGSRHSEIIRQINLLIPKILDYENFIDSIPQGKTINELMAMDDERKAGYLNESIRQYIALNYNFFSVMNIKSLEYLEILNYYKIFAKEDNGNTKKELTTFFEHLFHFLVRYVSNDLNQINSAKFKCRNLYTLNVVKKFKWLLQSSKK